MIKILDRLVLVASLTLLLALAAGMGWGAALLIAALVSP